MLGQLAGQDEADGGLDLARRDGRLLAVVGEARRLHGDALEDVVDERVHDRHGLRRRARVGVHLLQHAVDVDRERLVALLLPLRLVARAHRLLRLRHRLGRLAAAAFGRFRRLLLHLLLRSHRDRREHFYSRGQLYTHTLDDGNVLVCM